MPRAKAKPARAAKKRIIRPIETVTAEERKAASEHGRQVLELFESIYRDATTSRGGEDVSFEFRRAVMSEWRERYGRGAMVAVMDPVHRDAARTIVTLFDRLVFMANGGTPDPAWQRHPATKTTSDAILRVPQQPGADAQVSEATSAQNSAAVSRQFSDRSRWRRTERRRAYEDLAYLREEAGPTLLDALHSLLDGDTPLQQVLPRPVFKKLPADLTLVPTKPVPAVKRFQYRASMAKKLVNAIVKVQDYGQYDRQSAVDLIVEGLQPTGPARRAA